MKTKAMILTAILGLQSFAWARGGEADLCQKQTVGAAMKLALEDYQNGYIVDVTLMERQRDNDNNVDEITIQLTSITNKKKLVKYTLAITNESTCQVMQIGGWYPAK